MGSYGPEHFQLKTSQRVVIRHCEPADAPGFPEFQKKVAVETTFTMQVSENTPAIEKVREAWKQSSEDPCTCGLGYLRVISSLGSLDGAARLKGPTYAQLEGTTWELHGYSGLFDQVFGKEVPANFAILDG